VQEVFIKLWKMGERLDEYDSIEALATTMTKNYCIDQVRRQKHVQQNDSSQSESSDLMFPSPQEQLENRESGEIINRIIDNMPEVYRSLIKLRDVEGVSYEEIAEKTNQNINTIRVTISRARKLIREEYNKNHYERSGAEEITR